MTLDGDAATSDAEPARKRAKLTTSATNGDAETELDAEEAADADAEDQT